MTTMTKQRSGFTVIELVIVVVLVGIAASISLSGLTRSRQRVQNTAAQRYVEAYAIAARAVALQRGRTAALRVAGDSMWVTVDSAGTTLLLRPPVRLRQDFGVTAVPTAAAVFFDPRGFAPTLPANGARFVLQPATRAVSSVSDTVCVSPTGQIRTRGCV